MLHETSTEILNWNLVMLTHNKTIYVSLLSGLAGDDDVFGADIYSFKSPRKSRQMIDKGEFFMRLCYLLETDHLLLYAMIST